MARIEIPDDLQAYLKAKARRCESTMLREAGPLLTRLGWWYATSPRSLDEIIADEVPLGVDPHVGTDRRWAWPAKGKPWPKVGNRVGPYYYLDGRWYNTTWRPLPDQHAARLLELLRRGHISLELAEPGAEANCKDLT